MLPSALLHEASTAVLSVFGGGNGASCTFTHASTRTAEVDFYYLDEFYFTTAEKKAAALHINLCRYGEAWHIVAASC